MRRRHRGEPCAADATAAAATEELRVAIEDVRAATEDLRAAIDDLRAAVEVSRGVAAAAVRAAAPPNAGGKLAGPCWAWQAALAAFFLVFVNYLFVNY